MKNILLTLLFASLVFRPATTVSLKFTVSVFDIQDATMMVILRDTQVSLLGFDKPGEFLNNKTRDCNVSWYADNEFGENRYHETWLLCAYLSP